MIVSISIEIRNEEGHIMDNIIFSKSSFRDKNSMYLFSLFKVTIMVCVFSSKAVFVVVLCMLLRVISYYGLILNVQHFDT